MRVFGRCQHLNFSCRECFRIHDIPFEALTDKGLPAVEKTRVRLSNDQGFRSRMACRLSFREKKNINLLDGRGVANVARVEEGVVDKLAVSLELILKFNLDRPNSFIPVSVGETARTRVSQFQHLEDEI